MKAIYKGNIAEVWQITKDGKYPDWVQEAFEKNYLYWLDNHVRVLMSGLNPSLKKNFEIGAVGTAGGGFAGYGMYQLGYIGDYIDITNRRIVSERTFKKQYNILDSSE
ncbi:hypothetical protein [Streptococcus porcinus]|uniref:Role in replication n=1 Tax=Streptococcus porcinus TaxID=1340 RepID=A0A7V9WR45_STRPO|nr:hypothetical protein [Streptococcus porcinus]MBA2795504.1 hypothetical protein [Streptococcus porcinus]